METSRTLAVTGASGFIGSHITQQLLQLGHTVRACVLDLDDPQEVQHLRALSTDLPGTLELATGNLLVPGSYAEAFDGADAVIHSAAIVQSHGKNPQKEIIEPSLIGTQTVLDCAKDAGIQRFVQTSSLAAAIVHTVTDRPYTEADWNHLSTIQNDPYGMAKRQAEELANTYGLEHGLNPVAILPGLVLGPVFSAAQCEGSVKTVKDIFLGDIPGCPALHFGVVDVREVAQAHVRAALDPSLTGRFLLCAASRWMLEMGQELKAIWPDRNVVVRKMSSAMMRIVALLDARMSSAVITGLIDRAFWYDNTRSQAELGIEYRPVADTLRDCVQSMLDRGFIE
jgi:nucleoside-diphosphate-sugar epimerase